MAVLIDKFRWFAIGVTLVGLPCCLRHGNASSAAGSGGDESTGLFSGVVSAGSNASSGGGGNASSGSGVASSGIVTAGSSGGGSTGSFGGGGGGSTGSVGGGGGGSTGSGDPAADVAQWNQLSAELDAARSMFLGPNVDYLQAVGNQLFWQDITNADPILKRYDDTTKLMSSYSFSTAGYSIDYRASANLVVVADNFTSPATYYAYDANTGTELDSTMDTRPAGANWVAYAVSGSTAYFVDTSVAGATTLYRWIPGQAPTAMTTLESAGAQIGEFDAFGVDGNTMVFVESGRVWKMDLAANTATWLMNQTQVSGGIVDFESDGVMFTTSAGLMFFDYAKGAITNESDRINQNPYQVNATFAIYSKYLYDFARWKNYILYIGENGLFAYDMVNDAIAPILLSPLSATLRVDYRYPVALDDGTAFVTGLTSTDGAVGADGPTYKIDLTAILK